MELVLFYVFGGVAVVASLLVIGQRNPMYSVLLLIASFGGLAGLYVLLDSPFIAVIQIIVYAGAIMVLFLFVVMLLNAGHEDVEPAEAGAPQGLSGLRRFGAILAAVLVLQLIWALSHVTDPWREPAPADPPISSVAEIGRVLFTEHAFAFLVTAVLTLVAMIGAVLLAAQRSGEPGARMTNDRTGAGRRR